MACPNVFDGFKVATEFLSHDIYRIASFRDPWINLIPRGVFPKNVGTNPFVFTVGKSEPTSEERVGASITLANGSNQGVCSYSFTDVAVGFNEDNYAPMRLQWKGPLFCKDDQYFNHDPDAFLGGYVQEMAEYVRKDLSNPLPYHYLRRVPIYVASRRHGRAELST